MATVGSDYASKAVMTVHLQEAMYQKQLHQLIRLPACSDDPMPVQAGWQSYSLATRFHSRGALGLQQQEHTSHARSHPHPHAPAVVGPDPLHQGSCAEVPAAEEAINISRQAAAAVRRDGQAGQGLRGWGREGRAHRGQGSWGLGWPQLQNAITNVHVPHLQGQRHTNTTELIQYHHQGGTQ